MHIECGGVVPLPDTGAVACGAVRPGGPGAGEPCDLVTVPVRTGLEAVDILRLRDRIGPVLHDGARGTLGFLVPPGTAAGWDVPGSACTPTHTHAVRPSSRAVGGDSWLVPPERAYGRATEPSRLRAALRQAARTIEAVDRSR